MDLLAHSEARYAGATPLRSELNRALGEVEEQVLHKGSDPVLLLGEVQVAFASK